MVAQLVFIAERCSPYSTIDFYWVLSCQLILNRDIKIDHFQSCSNIIQMGLFSDNFQTLCVGLIKYHHILVDFFLSLSKSCATAKGMCKTKKKGWCGQVHGLEVFFFVVASNLLQSFLSGEWALFFNFGDPASSSAARISRTNFSRHHHPHHLSPTYYIWPRLAYKWLWVRIQVHFSSRTLFENYTKCRIWILAILAFSAHFCMYYYNRPVW